VFLSHYLANSTFPGATSLDYAFVGGLSISMALLLSPLATFTTKRFGTRTTLFLGIFFETLALIGASFATKIWHLFLSQGLCFGWGMGFLFVGTVGIVPQWFTTKRSFANGIATAGSGMGGLTYSLATNAMIRSIGLGWAFRVLGIVACAVNISCALLIRDRNKQVGASQVPFDVRLFKRLEYNMMLAWGFFSMLGYITLLFSLPNYALSIGLTPSQGSVVGALLNLGQGIGRPLVGMFSDKAGRINIATGLSFLCGVFCLVIWVFAKSYGVLIFFAILSGTTAGTVWATIAPVGAEVTGLKDLPSALSIAWVIFSVPATFAEPIALELRQKTGNIYLHAQVYTGFMYIASAICLYFVRVWKIGQLEALAAEIGRPGAIIDASEARTLERTITKESMARRSGVLKRIVTWKRV
jgi:MFS family permease